MSQLDKAGLHDFSPLTVKGQLSQKVHLSYSPFLTLFHKGPRQENVNAARFDARRCMYNYFLFGVIQLQDIFGHPIHNFSKAGHNKLSVGPGFIRAYNCISSL